METDFLVKQMNLYNTSIEDVGFSEGVLYILQRNDYKTIGKLARKDVQKILKIPGIHENERDEIVEKLGAMGISIDGNADNLKKLLYDKPGKYPYPNNLIAAIRDVDPEQLAGEQYTRDQLTGIAVALSTLSEQEETMITLRYKHGATLLQIGNYYGVTNERARQLIHQGVRKLRHPVRYRLINKGLSQYIDDETQKRAGTKVSNLLHLEYSRGYRDGVAAAIRAGGDKKRIIDTKLLQTPIQELDLSVRSYNVLLRANINKLGDILTYDTIDAICSIRNIGHKSAAEIARILCSYGVCNSAWESFLISKKEE